MHERERILKMLHGERTDVLPWATRLDIWHAAQVRAHSLPAEMADMDLMGIHRYLGIGRQRCPTLVLTRLRGVELTVEFNGAVVSRITDPCMSFPRAGEVIVRGRVGEQRITFQTPVGTAQIIYRSTPELLDCGVTVPYLGKHILADESDFDTVKWILNHADLVPAFEDFDSIDAELGDDGFTIGMLARVPFQRLLLDFMGEERAFYWMLDDPRRFQYLLELLTEHGRRMLELALESSAPMLEFPDNFDGMITSPNLFREHCMPFLQESADKVHACGRFLGSHMDGDMRPLLHLVPETGVDVAESFSPAPLSSLTFEEAWNAWRGKVLMWGAIPSPIFEGIVPEHEFETAVADMLDLIGDDGRIILGIGDQAVGATLIERMRRVSEMLGR